MRNKALKILFISNGIFVFADRLLGPIYAIYMDRFEVNITSVGLSWAVFMGASTIFTLFVRKYGDKILEQEYLLIAGFLIRSLCWILYIFVYNFPILLVVQIILGVGEAIGSPAFDSILSQHLRKGHQIEEYSDWKFVQNLSLSLAALAGGFVAQALGFNVLLIIMAALGVISSLIVFFQPRKLL